MSADKHWGRPFLKQCFAVSSVTLNIFSYGMVIGFTANLFSELRKTQDISLDRNSESWLASLIGITIFVGAMLTPIIIDRVGRKPALILSFILMIGGWISFSLASSLLLLLVAKILQGTSVGLGLSMGGILIAEYSSPKYRGAFVSTIPAGLLFGCLISHSLGLFYNWREISTILAFFPIPGIIVAIFSPESPTFLATQGRYDECRKSFRWLRGLEEDDELEKMIKADMIVKEFRQNHKEHVRKKIMKKMIYVFTLFKKREFRIPVFIVLHLKAINKLCGSLLHDIYPSDIYMAVYGTDIYMYQIIISLDVQRIISTVLAIYIVTKFRRRPLIFTLVGLNILAYMCEAGYIYAKRHHILPFDHLGIGIFLHHFLYFTNGAGSIPLTFVIANELHPIEGRGVCGLICTEALSTYLFLSIKTAPYLFSQIGVDGICSLYAAILFYCLVVLYYVLPETKDKTLQQIEDRFRGYSIINRRENFKMTEHLVC